MTFGGVQTAWIRYRTEASFLAIASDCSEGLQLVKLVEFDVRNVSNSGGERAMEGYRATKCTRELRLTTIYTSGFSRRF